MKNVGSFFGRTGRPVVALLFVLLLAFLSAGPVRSAPGAGFEAETMKLPAGKGGVYADRTASGGEALKVRSNAAAHRRVSLSGSFSAVVVRAGGDSCAGSPRMEVEVDGKDLGSRKVVTGGWNDYRLAAGVGAGPHTVSVAFKNDYRRAAKCDRNLRLDRVSFVPVSVSGQTQTPQPPAGSPATGPSPEGSAPASGFVGVSGRGFVLDGRPFRFVGANLTNTAGDPNIGECGPWVSGSGATGDAQVEDWFRRAREDFGGNVLRVWLYQSFTAGGTDWHGFDRTVQLARKYGYKIIPVLENQWPECTQGGYKYDTWYESGYKEPYGSYGISYKEYVRRVVERYKDDPTIAAWMLMNEAESKSPDGTPDPQALYDFTKDVSGLVKSLDPNHLVTLGTIGAGQPGASGADWTRLNALPTIDFTEFHDYAHDGESLPGEPLEPSVDLNTAVFAQDANWTWTNADYRLDKARSWETFTYTLPAGTAPFERIGLNFYGGFSGDVYLDDVRVGDRTYGFENGTTEGFGASAPVAPSNSGQVAYSGERSLKLEVSKAQDAQVWLEPGPEAAPGTQVSFKVYVDDPGNLDGDYSLAAAIARSEDLGKPIIVGEAGMTTCGSYDGSQTETPQSRAEKFDAKMGAFFRAGGAGYLAWVWHPDSDCAYEFTTGDPLNAVLKKYAGSAG